MACLLFSSTGHFKVCSGIWEISLFCFLYSDHLTILTPLSYFFCAFKKVILLHLNLFYP